MKLRDIFKSKKYKTIWRNGVDAKVSQEVGSKGVVNTRTIEGIMFLEIREDGKYIRAYFEYPNGDSEIIGVSYILSKFPDAKGALKDYIDDVRETSDKEYKNIINSNWFNKEY